MSLKFLKLYTNYEIDHAVKKYFDNSRIQLFMVTVVMIPILYGSCFANFVAGLFMKKIFTEKSF